MTPTIAPESHDGFSDDSNKAPESHDGFSMTSTKASELPKDLSNDSNDAPDSTKITRQLQRQLKRTHQNYTTT
ncbi:18506_t:CDS:2 [Racocetra persica]|uniref:18506_t:CDS:1 n=1 Tax=Racocetra persica TaxID=160502 RepID=A0ACA9QSV4_9GLOM|nr:18506_t:CDS:2 [Racocetra persica]